MNRRGVAVGLGSGATLLLAAWVSAAGPAWTFVDQRRSGTESSAPGEDYGPGAAPPPTGDGLPRADVPNADPGLVSTIELVMKLLLVAVVLVVLVALGRALLDWWHQRAVGDDPAAAVDVVPEALLEAAVEGERLVARGVPSDAVIAAWVALEDACRAAGIRDDQSRTSTELVTAVLRSHRVERAPLDTLGGLYREARFSTHPIGEEHRSAARAALVQVQGDLRRTMERLARERMASR